MDFLNFVINAPAIPRVVSMEPLPDIELEIEPEPKTHIDEDDDDEDDDDGADDMISDISDEEVESDELVLNTRCICTFSFKDGKTYCRHEEHTRSRKQKKVIIFELFRYDKFFNRYKNYVT